MASAVIQFGLAATFVRRYSRKFAGRTAQRAEKTARPVWWRPWLPTRGFALAWLAWREAVPLCLPGLAIACLMTPINMDWWEVSREEAIEAARLATNEDGAALLAEYQQRATQLAEGQTGDVGLIEERLEVDYPGDASEVPPEVAIRLKTARGPIVAPHRFKYVWRVYKDAMPSIMWFIGGLWAVVVGCGLFSPEIDWRIGEFWRTRPIAAWRLFGIKFIAGLLAVLLVLDGTVIAAGWNSPHWGEYHSMNWAYIACILPLHATLFSLAVAWTCVLRRAAVGAVAALLTNVGMSLALSWSAVTRDFDPIAVYNNFGTRRGSLDLTDFHYPVVAAAMGLILVASMLIGWLALRRYDPRRQTG